MNKLLFIMLVMIPAFGAAAKERVLLESKKEIIRQAIKELDDALIPPEGELYKSGQKFAIKGEYNFQLTIRDKGNVVSVFVVDQKNGDIPSQNRLKDAVFTFRLSFKMPKNKDYKFNYIFKF
jgi:hypothetical protein